MYVEWSDRKKIEGNTGDEKGGERSKRMII